MPQLNSNSAGSATQSAGNHLASGGARQQHLARQALDILNNQGGIGKRAVVVAQLKRLAGVVPELPTALFEDLPSLPDCHQTPCQIKSRHRR